MKPNARSHLELELLLRLERELAGRRFVGGGARGDLLHERRLMRLEIVEQAAHLRRLHVPLEVVEHDVVRLVAHRRSSRCSACADRGWSAGRAGSWRSRCSCARRPRPGFASAAERDISARRSAGTRRALSQSRETTRIRLASNESYSCCSPKSRSSSSRRPTSAEVNFSCAIRPTVASCSARIAAPRRGIITCWSHASSDIVLPRSLISCSRLCSSSNDARLTAEKRISRGSNVLRRARRGSSEDDLPLRVSHASNDGDGRGLNPPPNERGTRRY